MIYDKELVQYKNTKFPHPPGLLIFSPLCRTNKGHNSAELQVKNNDFGSNSIHAVQYLWEPGTRASVRLFWILVIIAAIGTCFTMYSMLTKRHREQVLSTVVETSQLPIYMVQFPSVAVCPWHQVNWMRYNAAEQKFLPPRAGTKVKEIFFEVLTAIEGMTLTTLAPIAPLMKHKIPPSVGKIALHELANFVSFRCDELFVSCHFAETPHECCKIFVAERTERGYCLVFNSLVSKDSKMKTLTDAFYPWRVRTSGEESGLAFTLRYNRSHYRSTKPLEYTFNLMIKEAEEWSDSLYHIMLPNTNNFLSVTPTLRETAANTRSMNPQNRRCLFSDEKSTVYDRIERLPFNMLNCRTKCQQKFVMKHCNCTLSLFFPELSDYPNQDCKVADLPCIYKHKDVFNYMKGAMQDEYVKDTRRGMECDCVDNCLSLTYTVSPNTNPIHDANESVPEIRADIYFSKNVMTKYGTHLDYTFSDFLANFGGVMGLCLGASALSIIEIFYGLIKFAIVGLMVLRNKRRKRFQVNVVKAANVNNAKLRK